MEGDIDSLGANVLAGVAKMVVAFGDQLRDETFKEKVGFCLFVSFLVLLKSAVQALSAMPKLCLLHITENASTPYE